MTNRLAASTSPVPAAASRQPRRLRWEWSPEAFAEAERRDLPVLLSIGYAARHWCHVAGWCLTLRLPGGIYGPFHAQKVPFDARPAPRLFVSYVCRASDVKPRPASDARHARRRDVASAGRKLRETVAGEPPAAPVIQRCPRLLEVSAICRRQFGVGRCLTRVPSSFTRQEPPQARHRTCALGVTAVRAGLFAVLAERPTRPSRASPSWVAQDAGMRGRVASVQSITDRRRAVVPPLVGPRDSG